MIIVDTTEEPAIAETEISGNSGSSTSKPKDQSNDPNRTTEGLPHERENPNPEFWHDVLVHRYDYEVERMNNLKSQSTFILGAIGLISTLLENIYTADYRVPIIILVIIFLVAAIIAFWVFITVHGWRYCLAYPSNEHIALPIPLDKLNSDLVSIIQLNSNHNDKMMIHIQRALICLILGLSGLIIMIFIVVFLAI